MRSKLARRLAFGGSLEVASRLWRASGTDTSLRRDDEIVATGHLILDTPVSAGDPIAIGSSRGTVRDVQPMYGQQERRLVIDLGTPERVSG